MSTQLDSITKELFSHNAIEVLDGGEETDALYYESVQKADDGSRSR